MKRLLSVWQVYQHIFTYHKFKFNLKLVGNLFEIIIHLGTFDDQLSPLHIAAKFNFKLFKEIAPKFVNKNPSNSCGDTPLLCAVKNGHSDICAYIVDNVDENKKNPADNFGFTPLHYAAMLNDLKIYKLIAENIEDKHPQDDMGTTPLHIAVENDHLDICNFVSDKTVKKEDIQQISVVKIRIISLCTHKKAFREKGSYCTDVWTVMKTKNFIIKASGGLAFAWWLK